MAKNSQKNGIGLLRISVAIFIIGLFLRIFFLGRYPTGFHAEEALSGWRAETLLKTGADEVGRSHPLIFSSLSGYQLPLKTYFLMPSTYVLGLSELSARLPFSLIGALSVLLIFGIATLLFPNGDKRIGLWSAFILAISPWAVFNGRFVSVAGLSLFLFLSGAFFILLAEKNKKMYAFAFLSFLFLLYNDKSSWLFLFPFLSVFSVFMKKKEILLFLSLLIIFMIPVIFSYFKAPQFKTDFLVHDVSLFANPATAISINAMRGEDIVSELPLLGKFFYNKTFYAEKLLENFLKHFNPRFYFASGDSNPLYGLTNFGPILLIFLPFTLLGIGKMFTEHKRQFDFLVFWFILGVVPSALVLPSPDQSKIIFLMPVLIIFAAYFLANLKKTLIFLIMLLVLFNSLVVIYDAVLKEPVRVQDSWMVGYKDLATFIGQDGKKYDAVFLTDSYGSDPGPLLLFYSKYPSTSLKTETNQLVHRQWINQVDNILIDRKESWEINKRSMYIIGPKEKDWFFNLGGGKINFKTEKIITNLDNKVIFEIFSYSPYVKK